MVTRKVILAQTPGPVTGWNALDSGDKEYGVRLVGVHWNCNGELRTLYLGGGEAGGGVLLLHSQYETLRAEGRNLVIDMEVSP